MNRRSFFGAVLALIPVAGAAAVEQPSRDDAKALRMDGGETIWVCNPDDPEQCVPVRRVTVIRSISWQQPGA